MDSWFQIAVKLLTADVLLKVVAMLHRVHMMKNLLPVTVCHLETQGGQVYQERHLADLLPEVLSDGCPSAFLARSLLSTACLEALVAAEEDDAILESEADVHHGVVLLLGIDNARLSSIEEVLDALLVRVQWPGRVIPPYAPAAGISLHRHQLSQGDILVLTFGLHHSILGGEAEPS